MFLYGPPGTGKSSIAERLLRIYGDHVLVPYAVEVDSQIINVFDPVVHKPARGAAAGDRPPVGAVPAARASSSAASSRPEMLDLRTSATAASTWPRCRCRPTTASS